MDTREETRAPKMNFNNHKTNRPSQVLRPGMIVETSIGQMRVEKIEGDLITMKRVAA